MVNTGRYLRRMFLFLLCVISAVLIILPALKTIYMTSPVLNGLIFAVIIIGISLNFRQVFLLKPEVAWIERFKENRAEVSASHPILLSPLAKMVKDHPTSATFRISPMSARTLLDSVDSRLEEAKDISKYFSGICIFLGLLGTFWGLMQTVASVGDVISSMNVDGASGSILFSQLKESLKAPLSGMGTAFSSSLLGLSGSLVLGFLDLQASQAQNLFYNELDDWLTGITYRHKDFSEEGSGYADAYVISLFEGMLKKLEELNDKTEASDEASKTLNRCLMEISSKFSTIQKAAIFTADSLEHINKYAIYGEKIHKLIEASSKLAAENDKLILSEITEEIKLLGRGINANIKALNK